MQGLVSPLWGLEDTTGKLWKVLAGKAGYPSPFTPVTSILLVAFPQPSGEERMAAPGAQNMALGRLTLASHC